MEQKQCSKPSTRKKSKFELGLSCFATFYAINRSKRWKCFIKYPTEVGPTTQSIPHTSCFWMFLDDIPLLPLFLLRYTPVPGNAIESMDTRPMQINQRNSDSDVYGLPSVVRTSGSHKNRGFACCPGMSRHFDDDSLWTSIWKGFKGLKFKLWSEQIFVLMSWHFQALTNTGSNRVGT